MLKSRNISGCSIGRGVGIPSYDAWTVLVPEGVRIRFGCGGTSIPIFISPGEG